MILNTKKLAELISRIQEASGDERSKFIDYGPIDPFEDGLE